MEDEKIKVAFPRDESYDYYPTDDLQGAAWQKPPVVTVDKKRFARWMKAERAWTRAQLDMGRAIDEEKTRVLNEK